MFLQFLTVFQTKFVLAAICGTVGILFASQNVIADDRFVAAWAGETMLSPVRPHTGNHLQMGASPTAVPAVITAAALDRSNSRSAARFTGFLPKAKAPGADEGSSNVFAGGAVDADGWHFSRWFGYYNVTNWPWINHDELGWAKVERADDGSRGVWLFLADGGWVWTDEGVFPQVFSDSHRGWHHLELANQPATAAENPPVVASP